MEKINTSEGVSIPRLKQNCLLHKSCDWTRTGDWCSAAFSWWVYRCVDVNSYMQHWGLYVWLVVFYEHNHMNHHEKLCHSVDKWQCMQSHYSKLHIILHVWGMGRSQRPHRLIHEMSSLTWMLGSWVQIPLKAWMFICVYSVFVLSCVGSGLVMGWSPIQGVLLTVLRLRNWSKMTCFMDALCSKWEQQEDR
jgi:hypothetical protein